jgi:predicted nucleic acid-binding protein
MTSSSNLQIERGLDAMLIVYSLLNGHPASVMCEQFIRNRTGWFTTTFTLFEAKTILTKVYSVDSALASQKLAKFAASPIIVVAVDLATALTAMRMADTFGIDLTDAVLLQTSQLHGALLLATEDKKLVQACQKIGITPETPIDATLRQQIAAWEVANLPAKGLPRILRHIHQWLNQIHPQTAQDFWSQTGGGSHLP